MKKLLMMKSLGAFLVSCVVLVPAISSAADLPAPTGDAVVAPDAKWELLYTRTKAIKGGLTEGPAVAPDGSIYFTDIPFGEDRGLIVRFDPKTKQNTLFSEDSGKANGLVFDREGNLLACEGANLGGRCVSRWDVKAGTKKSIADGVDGKRFNAPNDICLDAAGRIYFTDPKYLGDEPQELKYMAVYCIEPNGTIREATHDVSKPNGIAISPDGKTLYLADHDNGSTDVTKPGPPKAGNMKIYAFPLEPNGNIGAERRTIVDFGDKKGCDGMTVDADGRIYLTVREPSRPGIMVIDPTGKEVAFIPTGAAGQTGPNPVGLPSNVEFGLGDEANVLYATIDLSLARIPLKVKGFHVQYGK